MPGETAQVLVTRIFSPGGTSWKKQQDHAKVQMIPGTTARIRREYNEILPGGNIKRRYEHTRTWNRTLVKKVWNLFLFPGLHQAVSSRAL